MLVILTGTPAAGKSTVGDALARRFPKSAYFSVDTIRHFIKGGYLHPTEDTEEERQVLLATEIAKGIVQKYIDAGFVVVIDDVVGDRDIQRYKDAFQDVHAFLLLPSLDVLKQRDNLRPSESRMGGRIDELYPYFAHSDHPLMEVLDTSNQTVLETVDDVFGRVVSSRPRDDEG